MYLEMEKYFMPLFFDQQMLKPLSEAIAGRYNPNEEADARTRYRTLRWRGSCAYVELEALTGRKHQIRVHLADGLSCPIVGE